MKSLTSTLLFSRFWLKIIILLIAFMATIFSLCSPYFQKQFIDSLLKNNFIGDYKREVFLITAAIFFAVFAQLISFINKTICYYEGSRVQKWLSELTYSKTLHLKNKSQSITSAGQIISIYSTDTLAASNLIDDILPNFISYILPIILSPIAVLFIVKINPLPIFLTIFLILGMNFFFAIRQGGYFSAYKRLAAERVGVVNEWLNNIRSIRILGWTGLFEEKIQRAREVETQNRLKMVTNGSALNSISYSAPFFINLIAIFFLIKMKGKNISAGEVFSLLWIFSVVLTRPMRMLPMMLVTISDCYTSLKRIENYLSLESEKEENYLSNIVMTPAVAPMVRLPDDKNLLSVQALSLKNLNIKIENNIILKNISLNIKKGEFIAIVGGVGAGKSLLFQAILGFIECEYEEYKINGKNVSLQKLNELRSHFSLVPQELFIMNASFRDNISLSYKTDKSRDNEILQALKLAQFDLENENVPFGLDTEIGERGVNLSGGQKQRIALARAHFMNRDIILLDDCISALDANTEIKINQSLLNGEWKNKTRILITHRLSIVSQVDRVLVIRKGEIFEK